MVSASLGRRDTPRGVQALPPGWLLDLLQGARPAQSLQAVHRHHLQLHTSQPHTTGLRDMLPTVALRKAEIRDSLGKCALRLFTSFYLNSYKENQGSKVGLQQFPLYSLGQREKGGTIKERNTIGYFLPSTTPEGPEKGPLPHSPPHIPSVPVLPRAFTWRFHSEALTTQKLLLTKYSRHTDPFTNSYHPMSSNFIPSLLQLG